MICWYHVFCDNNPKFNEYLENNNDNNRNSNLYRSILLLMLFLFFGWGRGHLHIVIKWIWVVWSQDIFGAYSRPTCSKVIYFDSMRCTDILFCFDLINHISNGKPIWKKLFTANYLKKIGVCRFKFFYLPLYWLSWNK